MPGLALTKDGTLFVCMLVERLVGAPPGLAAWPALLPMHAHSWSPASPDVHTRDPRERSMVARRLRLAILRLPRCRGPCGWPPNLSPTRPAPPQYFVASESTPSNAAKAAETLGQICTQFCAHSRTLVQARHRRRAGRRGRAGGTEPRGLRQVGQLSQHHRVAVCGEAPFQRAAGGLVGLAALDAHRSMLAAQRREPSGPNHAHSTPPTPACLQSARHQHLGPCVVHMVQGALPRLDAFKVRRPCWAPPAPRCMCYAVYKRLRGRSLPSSVRLLGVSACTCSPAVSHLALWAAQRPPPPRPTPTPGDAPRRPPWSRALQVGYQLAVESGFLCQARSGSRTLELLLQMKVRG